MKLCDTCEFTFPDSCATCAACGRELIDVSAREGFFHESISGILDPDEPISVDELFDRLHPHSAFSQTDGATPDPFPQTTQSAAAQLTPRIIINPRSLEFGRFKKSKKGAQTDNIKPVTVKIESEGSVKGTVEASHKWIAIDPAVFYLSKEKPETRINVTVNTGRLGPGKQFGFLTFVTPTQTEQITYDLKITESWWGKHHKTIQTWIALIAAIPVLGILAKIDQDHFPFRNRRPILNPIQAEAANVKKGQIVKLIALAHDDDGDELKYEWSADYGKIEPEGDSNRPIVSLNTSTIEVDSKAKSIDVSLIVSDGYGGSDRDKKTIIVEPELHDNLAERSKNPKPSEPPYLPKPNPRSKKPAAMTGKHSTEGGPLPRILEPYRYAMQLFRDMQYERALEVCNEALKKEPGDLDLIALRQRIENTLSDLNERNNAPIDPRTTERKVTPQPSEQRRNPSLAESTPAIIKRRIEPIYPTEARQANIHGTVVVEIIIDEEGDVINAKAISGMPQLRQAAIDAARKSKFYPARSGGQPIRDRGTITYNFNPDR